MRGCDAVRLAAVALLANPTELGYNFGTIPPFPLVGMEEPFVDHPKEIMRKFWAVVELMQFLHPLLPRRVVSSPPCTGHGVKSERDCGGLTLITDGFNCAVMYLPSLLIL